MALIRKRAAKPKAASKTPTTRAPKPLADQPAEAPVSVPTTPDEAAKLVPTRAIRTYHEDEDWL